MNYRIATIEDDLLIAADIKNKLENLGHVVVGNARSYDESLVMVEEAKPEIIISDILLEGEKDGIEAIAKIYDFYKCPVIYLTANSETTMVKRAMKTHPAAILIKPFKLSEFAINIDLAVQNFKSQIDFEKANPKITDSIFLPDQNTFVRIFKKDILYIKADGSYVEVITQKKSYHLASNLKNFHRQFEDDQFMRISRSFLVNLNYVCRINGNMIYLQEGQHEIPLIFSKDRRQDILDRFQVLKTK